MEGKRVRIIIVDDHLIGRAGLRLVLEEQADFELVGEAADGASVVHLIEEHLPQVILLHMRQPGPDDLTTIAQIRKRWPQVAVVILTSHADEELILQGLHAGVASYLIKDTDRATLFHAIRTAARGETLLKPEIVARLLARTTSVGAGGERHKPGGRKVRKALTGREHDILVCVARGERNKEIATRLGISEPTVKTHLSSIYYKFGVDSRASAITVAIERGLLTFPEGFLSTI